MFEGIETFPYPFEEQRAEPRVPAHGEAWLDHLDGKQIPVVLDNVSREGVCVSGVPARWRVHPGEIVRIGFKSETSSSVIFLTCRVIWRCEGRLGLSFGTVSLPESCVPVMLTPSR